MIEHIWFDTSGTLYRETAEFETVHDNYRYQTYARLIGEKDQRKVKALYDQLYEQYGSNSAVFEALGMPPNYWQQKFEALDINALLQPDAEICKTLEVLKERVPISVFTNLLRSKLETLLLHLRIPIEYFTFILSGEAVNRPKPDLEGFLKMVELSKVPAKNILYVGDKVIKDIRPAKKVGMKTCLVWSESSEADYSVPAFRGILEVVSLDKKL